MSGSSLDGLDIAYCEFEMANGALQDWQLVVAETVPFDKKWVSRLAHLPEQSAMIFAQTHTYFGRYLAELTNAFIERHDVQPDYIASHGHTIFHHPEKLFTSQIGDGAAIAALTGITTIADFRTQDIALNGEGTPLAPMVDKMLFSDYDFLINIGGIANITSSLGGKYEALDIGAANQVFNYLAQQEGEPYDENGVMAAQGKVHVALLAELNAIPYFNQKPPKSLDNSWIRQTLWPIYDSYDIPTKDKLATACAQLAEQLARALTFYTKKADHPKSSYQLLASGGGAYNKFLIQTFEQHLQDKSIDIQLPSDAIIDFKEAILMALLGVLRIEGIPNTIASVTGAERDTIGGAVYVS